MASVTERGVSLGEGRASREFYSKRRVSQELGGAEKEYSENILQYVRTVCMEHRVAVEMAGGDRFASRGWMFSAPTRGCARSVFYKSMTNETYQKCKIHRSRVIVKTSAAAIACEVGWFRIGCTRDFFAR